MDIPNLFKRGAAITAASFLVLITAIIGAAQDPAKTVSATERTERPLPVAAGKNLYCAGFVQTSPIDTSSSLIGAVDEQEQFLYSTLNVVYISGGSNKGYKVGDVLSVVRPRGQVDTRWTSKGSLGFYVEELGAVELLRVRSDYSVAQIKSSCDAFLLGDIVQQSQPRTSPMHAQRPAMDVYAEPTGKAVGRLFMARDNLEMISRENIVYIDLGAEDNVKIGDYLTIFRPLGKGHVFMSNDGEAVGAASYGYESEVFKGGRFSNQAARKSGNTAGGGVVSVKSAKSGRPNLRKVVGEMVILNVKERTATALVTRTAGEVVTGDWVEVQ
ncbi:MAG TPA: hypothetical protein DEA22_10160 [Blastocatellia bacterium]|nr:hypothetical protein [Blastocatellia bacterium]